MRMYTTLMSAYGVSAGIDYKFGGKVANTLEAHRVIQHFQEEKGPVAADKIINCESRFGGQRDHGGADGMRSIVLAIL